jgi:hypothetical protein
MVLLVPEQTVVTSGPIDPFRIPKVSGILLHLEDVADPLLRQLWQFSSQDYLVYIM